MVAWRFAPHNHADQADSGRKSLRLSRLSRLIRRPAERHEVEGHTFNVRFISHMTWQDWATSASVVFGIVTMIAYLEQRRSAKQQATLIEFARRHVDKEISAEELQRLATERAALEAQITQQIPQLARAAVLMEQAEMHARAIAGYYLQWQEISKEIENHGEITLLDPDLEAVVLDRVLPRFELQEKRERWCNRVTILSVASAAAASVLPYPINRLVVYVVAIPLLVALVRLTSMQESLRVSTRLMRVVAYGIYLSFFFMFGGFGVIVAIADAHSGGLIPGSIVAFVATIALAIFQVIKKHIDRYVDFESSHPPNHVLQRTASIRRR